MKVKLKDYCKGIKGLIFDYGGTIDSEGDHWSEVILRAWRSVLGEAVNVALFRDAYVEGERAMARERIIMPDDDFRTTLLKKIRVELRWYVEHAATLTAPTEIETADRISTDPERVAEMIADDCDRRARRCVAEAKNVLTALGEKYPMVLVSNFYGNVNSVLSHYDVARYFREVVESAVVGVRKPDPKIFALGVEALGMVPDEVLVIGDTYKKDILPSLSLGCKAIWIKGKGWTPTDDAQDYPYIIRNLTELEDCLL